MGYVGDLPSRGVDPDGCGMQCKTAAKAQIAMLERNKRRKETGGFWDDQGRVKMEWQKPNGCCWLAVG